MLKRPFDLEQVLGHSLTLPPGVGWGGRWGARRRPTAASSSLDAVLRAVLCELTTTDLVAGQEPVLDHCVLDVLGGHCHRGLQQRRRLGAAVLHRSVGGRSLTLV